MRHALTIFSILYLSIAYGQNPTEDLFAKTVKEVIVSLSMRDSVRLSNFTRKKTGVYILYTIGTKDEYRHFGAIGFSDTSYLNYLFYNKVNFTAIKFAALPTFNCKTEKWTKKGLYVDTLIVDHLLSAIAESRNKNLQDKIPAKTISTFSHLENNSRRVVVTGSNYNIGLIFYLSYLNNKWILTIIDTVTCDCSV